MKLLGKFGLLVYEASELNKIDMLMILRLHSSLKRVFVIFWQNVALNAVYLTDVVKYPLMLTATQNDNFNCTSAHRTLGQQNIVGKRSATNEVQREARKCKPDF